MDFARKQLEKYGWTDGKGLGKHENGISEALKPKLKRSVTGIGHDLASDFTEHWWSDLYDKAAQNVQVEEKHGKTKKIKTKNNNFKITNNTWRIAKNSGVGNQEEYKEYFVRTAVLTNGARTEKVKESESEDEDVQKNLSKITDEELFAACEGRTAHKGARHGLKALGKLARIERQEQILLSELKYKGYSHNKRNKNDKLSMNDLQVVEDMSINSDGDSSIIKKKKKKILCVSINAESVDKGAKYVVNSTDKCAESMPKNKVVEIIIEHENDANSEIELISKKKSKKSKRNIEVDLSKEVSHENQRKKKKKLKSGDNKNCDQRYMNEDLAECESLLLKDKKSKKKSCR